jgi:hypothetical protein
MTKRLVVIFFFVYFLATGQVPCALASSLEGVVSRPEIEYSSGDLRDPFDDLLQKAIERERKEQEAKNAPVQEEETQAVKEEMPSLDKFNVQGVIWGGKFPQAIINNKILSVGDSVEGFKIANIEKNRVILSFAGRLISLPTPGISGGIDKKKVNK